MPPQTHQDDLVEKGKSFGFCKQRGKAAMRDYTSGFSIIEGVAQTLGWMCRIEWNVGSSRFEHRSHCDRHIDTSVEANGYSITYDNFALKQQMRQAVGALINVAELKDLSPTITARPSGVL